MMSSLPEKIEPFQPRAFPPLHLQEKIFSKHLQIANDSLKKFSNLLRRTPSADRYFSQLINLEVLASVKSQQVKTTLEKFLRFLQSKSPDKSSKLNLALNCREASIWAYKHIRKSPLSKELLCTIHRKAKRGIALKTDLGTYRNRQNWIGPVGCSIEDAYFYPPAEDRVAALMNELLLFARKNEKQPLVQLALIFAQLMIIHPFMDGNGRVARILIALFLYKKHVIPFPFLFVSRYFQKHRLRYFQRLFETTSENKWEQWIDFFLKGLSIEAKKSTAVFKQLISLTNKISDKFPSLKKRTLFFLFQNPIFSRISFEEIKGNKRLLNQLIETKIIRKESDGMYCFYRLLKILKEHQKQ